MEETAVRPAASATRPHRRSGIDHDALDRETLKRQIAAGELVPLVTLERLTGVDKKSLRALLDRYEIPTFPNPSRRCRVA